MRFGMTPIGEAIRRLHEADTSPGDSSLRNMPESRGGGTHFIQHSIQTPFSGLSDALNSSIRYPGTRYRYPNKYRPWILVAPWPERENLVLVCRVRKVPESGSMIPSQKKLGRTAVKAGHEIRN
jgi:hypothetical protein